MNDDNIRMVYWWNIPICVFGTPQTTQPFVPMKLNAFGFKPISLFPLSLLGTDWKLPSQERVCGMFALRDSDKTHEIMSSLEYHFGKWKWCEWSICIPSQACCLNYIFCAILVPKENWYHYDWVWRKMSKLKVYVRCIHSFNILEHSSTLFLLVISHWQSSFNKISKTSSGFIESVLSCLSRGFIWIKARAIMVLPM